MNNGNPLSSLLGITSANSAVTKTTAAKARAESTAKFQQALEQARPEVAARKPVARKETLPAENSSASRAAPKAEAQQVLRKDTNRANASANANDNKQHVDNKTLDKTARSPRDNAANEQTVERKNQEQTLAENQYPIASEHAQKIEAGELEQFLGEGVVATNSLLTADPTLLVTGETHELLESTENPLNPASVTLLELGGIANNGAIDLSQIHDETVGLDSPLSNPELLDLELLDPGFLASQSAVVPITAEGDLSSDANELSLSPLLANTQAALAHSASGLAVAGSIVDAQPAAIQTAAGALPSTLAVDELAMGDAEANAMSGVEADTGENPDFLLLNSKAAQNKITETAMTIATLDKAVSADVAKPAAINAAVETLTRLTEAQSPAARAFVVQTGVPVTVGTPQWSQAVGDKVLWLAAQNVTSAEIRLDPPELGPMQVKVSVNQDQASITFTSPHAAVREALDQQLNRLREMFSEQGLNLVNVDVSDKSFAQREREEGESAKQHAHAEPTDEELTPVGITQAISMRLVDHYA
jgi:flagellar hook-length control protein FliK